MWGIYVATCFKKSTRGSEIKAPIKRIKNSDFLWKENKINRMPKTANVIKNALECKNGKIPTKIPNNRIKYRGKFFFFLSYFTIKNIIKRRIANANAKCL